MSIVTVDLGGSPAAKLATLGLKMPQTRGVFSLNQASFLEPPTMVQANIATKTLVQIGAFCSIAGGKIGNVRIGRYCSIAPEVMIGSNEHPVDWLTSSRVTHVADLHDWARFCAPDRVDEIRSQRVPFKDACKITNIGNDVWIGQGVFIKAGVTIGDGAIVAGRSVVVKDVPAYSIVAGTPATVKRMRFPDATVERLTRLRWWRYSIFDLFGIPFDKIDEALDRIEEKVEAGGLAEYAPERITMDRLREAFQPPIPQGIVQAAE
ncbi:CatB-related O-acetyltransferase [Skermanella stibiiresistens]|uniref:CatB-related O-acetyltransferase n=1 Tax=Skermanella stibiiresistens TaxID=913326 RepID=UPI0009FF6D31|nr:CatB-related O-acetyltransferase [Skermanella stibiiresistens]